MRSRRSKSFKTGGETCVRNMTISWMLSRNAGSTCTKLLGNLKYHRFSLCLKFVLKRFGYWRKDAEDFKKFLQEKLILARAEHVGAAATGLQELAEFESDFLANKKSLERLETSGKEMIDEEHFASGEISRMIDELKVKGCKITLT